MMHVGTFTELPLAQDHFNGIPFYVCVYGAQDHFNMEG